MQVFTGNLRVLPLCSALVGVLFVAGPVSAQQSQAPSSPSPTSAAQSPDEASRNELANFNRFLEAHPEIGEQLRKDPSVIDNHRFLDEHPALQSYLIQHPAVRQLIQDNPSAFMHQENVYDRTADDKASRNELANFNRFLEAHPEIGEQLRRDPSLIDNHRFLDEHPALQTYLVDHPAVRQLIQDNPSAFMHQENQYERHDGQGDDVTRRELANFDRFLDSHREVAEQLQKDPSLIDNHRFLDEHPALQTYLQQHPETRQALQSNPNFFMQLEARYDQHENGMNAGGGGRDGMDIRAAHFGQFLAGHPVIAQDLSQDPSRAKAPEYLQQHPELQTYLQSHPDERDQLMNDPATFVKNAQTANGAPAAKGTPPPTSTTQPKPKQ
jgi:hypothetical protein